MNPVADSPGYEFDIRYISHAKTVLMLEGRHEGLQVRDLVDSKAFALEAVRLSTHNGTHADAPCHYASVKADKMPSRTIDHVPLDWFFRPGVKLNFWALEDGYIVQPDDVECELARIGRTLRALDIVVLNTSAGARFGTAAYLQSGCGMGRDATLHLAARGRPGRRHGRVELGRAVQVCRRALRTRR